MGKTYKGYELYKMIADRKIKKSSKFRDNNGQIWTWNEFNFIAERNYSDFVFSIMDFELLEDEEIDIQAIEQITETSTIDYSKNTKEMISAYQLIHRCEDKQINSNSKATR